MSCHVISSGLTYEHSFVSRSSHVCRQSKAQTERFASAAVLVGGQRRFGDSGRRIACRSRAAAVCSSARPCRKAHAADAGARLAREQLHEELEALHPLVQLVQLLEHSARSRAAQRAGNGQPQSVVRGRRCVRGGRVRCNGRLSCALQELQATLSQRSRRRRLSRCFERRRQWVVVHFDRGLSLCYLMHVSGLHPIGA